MKPRQRGLASLVTLLLAGLCTLVLATPAHAYPEDSCSIDINPTEVAAGGTLTVSGSATGPRSWTVQFAGETQTASGSDFTLEFTAPDVTSSKDFTVTVTSDPARASVTLSGCAATYAVTVLAGSGSAAPGGDDDGDSVGLPNTGGPSLWWLVVALLLLGAGSVAVRVARQDDSPTGE